MQWKNSHLSRGVGYIPCVWTRTIIDDYHRLCSRSCYHSRSSHRDHLFLARYGKDGTAPDWLDSFAILPNLFPELALHQWPSALQADALLTELSGIGETFFRESLVTKTQHTKKESLKMNQIQCRANSSGRNWTDSLLCLWISQYHCRSSGELLKKKQKFRCTLSSGELAGHPASCTTVAHLLK